MLAKTSTQKRAHSGEVRSVTSYSEVTNIESPYPGCSIYFPNQQQDSVFRYFTMVICRPANSALFKISFRVLSSGKENSSVDLSSTPTRLFHRTGVFDGRLFSTCLRYPGLTLLSVSSFVPLVRLVPGSNAYHTYPPRSRQL